MLTTRPSAAGSRLGALLAACVLATALSSVEGRADSPLPAGAELLPIRTSQMDLLSLRVEKGYTPQQERQAEICVKGRRVMVRRAIRQVLLESGCLERTEAGGSFVFDPVDWRATVTAVVPTTVKTTTFVRSEYGWRLVGSSKAPGRTRVELTWVGEGDVRAVPRVSAGMTYAIPPVYAWASLHLAREAQATGRIAFGGLGRRLAVTDAPGAVETWN